MPSDFDYVYRKPTIEAKKITIKTAKMDMDDDDYVDNRREANETLVSEACQEHPEISVLVVDTGYVSRLFPKYSKKPNVIAAYDHLWGAGFYKGPAYSKYSEQLFKIAGLNYGEIAIVVDGNIMETIDELMGESYCGCFSWYEFMEANILTYNGTSIMVIEFDCESG